MGASIAVTTRGYFFIRHLTLPVLKNDGGDTSESFIKNDIRRETVASVFSSFSLVC